MSSIVRTDGFVDRYLNRKCSRVLTRLFLKTPITPNAITLLAMAIGLVSAGCFAYGTYGAGIVGALLFQCSSIVDCCDGEVARIKRMESRFGDRLDIAADNIVHIAIVGAIAWALYREGESIGYVLLGIVAVTGMLLDVLVMFHHSPAGSATESRMDNLLGRLANRDFSVLVLLFALLSKLEWFLWLAAVGSHLYWMLNLVHRRMAVSANID